MKQPRPQALQQRALSGIVAMGWQTFVTSNAHSTGSGVTGHHLDPMPVRLETVEVMG